MESKKDQFSNLSVRRSIMDSKNYSLTWNPNPPITVKQLVAVAVGAGVYVILSWVGVVALPTGFFSVSALFVAVGFGIPFALWFGGWGFVIGFLGGFLGSGLLTGTPLPVAIPFGFVDFVQFGIPLVAYRTLAHRYGLDPLGRDVYTRKGFLFFLFTTVIPNNALGALLGVLILTSGGLIPPDAFWASVIPWWVGNMIVTVVIAPILMRSLSPVVERLGLTSRGLIT
jgi:integral membrane sensor domain MASE1